MADQIFTTDTKTLTMQGLKWLFIAAELFILLGNVYKLWFGLGGNYLNLASGICFFIYGLFFERTFHRKRLTIGDNAIRGHYDKGSLMPARNPECAWSKVKKVVLHNSYISVTKNNTTHQYFKLPCYATEQFKQIKECLHRRSEENEAIFKTKSWW